MECCSLPKRGGLEGRAVTAQGGALGGRTTKRPSPERARLRGSEAKRAPSGLGCFVVRLPRATPWAVAARPFRPPRCGSEQNSISIDALSNEWPISDHESSWQCCGTRTTLPRAGGQNSAPCRVSFFGGSYIRRLFFCACCNGQGIAQNVVHASLRVACCTTLADRSQLRQVDALRRRATRRVMIELRRASQFRFNLVERPTPRQEAIPMSSTAVAPTPYAPCTDDFQQT